MDPSVNQATKNQLGLKFPDLMNKYLRWQMNTKGETPKQPQSRFKGFEGKTKVNPQQGSTSRFKGFETTKPTPKVQPQQAGKFAKEMDILFGQGKNLGKAVEGAAKSPGTKKITGVISKVAPKILPQAGKFTPGLGTVLGVLGAAQAGYEAYRALQDRPKYDFINPNARNAAPNSVKELTPEEQKRVNAYEAAKTLQQEVTEDNPQQFLQEVQQEGESIPDIGYLPKVPQIVDYLPNKNQQNAIGTPISYVQTQGDITNPNFNLTPINEPPTNSNINQGDTNMGTQIPPSLRNYTSMIGAITQGAQDNTNLPRVGVSQEELEAYQNAINNQQDLNRQQQKQIEDVKAAILEDNKRQRMIDAANAIGGMLGGPRTETYHTLNPFTQQVDEFKIQRGRQYIPTEYRKDATELALKNLELDKMSREAQVNNAKAQAQLLNAARISNETGLPLNVVMEMEAKDYFNYLKPTQETKRDLTLQGAKAIADLIKDRQAGDILSGQQTQQQTVDMAIKQAQLNKDIEIAMTNNSTKLAVAKQLGMNSLQLERLRQSNPNAYYRAVGSVLMGASYYPQLGPQANRLGAQLFADILGQDNQDQGQQQGGGYYNGVNFNY